MLRNSLHDFLIIDIFWKITLIFFCLFLLDPSPFPVLTFYVSFLFCFKLGKCFCLSTYFSGSNASYFNQILATSISLDVKVLPIFSHDLQRKRKEKKKNRLKIFQDNPEISKFWGIMMPGWRYKTWKATRNAVRLILVEVAC